MTMATPNKPKPTLSNLPDVEDDLDDLDDVLDQFTPAPSKGTATSPPPPPPPPSLSPSSLHSPSGLVSPPPPPPTALATTTTFGRPRTNTRVDAPPMSVPGGLAAGGLDPTVEIDEDELSAEFSRELAKGMESLMREISGGSLPGEKTMKAGEGVREGGVAAAAAADDEEEVRQYKAAWERMLVEGMNGAGDEEESLRQLKVGWETMVAQGLDEMEGGDGDMKPQDAKALEQFWSQITKDAGKGKESAAGQPGKGEGAGTNAFQDKIKQAMDKLRESESNLQADSTQKTTAQGAAPDSLEALLASLNTLGLGEGDLPEDEGELANLLEGMMGQLMSKEILYDPLKELGDNLPSYLEKPPAPLSQGDRTRYESQLLCVRRIMAVFDKPSYKDDNAEDRKVISDMMLEMQSYGSPPSEVMGPLPPGVTLGPDGLPTGDGCVIA